MGTLFDYLDWRGDLSFSDAPFNEVDNLILSTICYMDFADIVPEDPSEAPVGLPDAIREYLQRHKGEMPYLGKLLPPQIVNLTGRAAKTRRFGELRLTAYVNRVDDAEQMQFSAITFLTERGRCYLAFRGTDDTLVGWKENFNMTFMQPIPAQTEAIAYLERVAKALPGDLYLGGHSKGGNLAIYAAVRCDGAYKNRILEVYNNDGPGFDRAFVESGEYEIIRAKLRTFVPQSSVVGMLLEHEENYEVIQSSASGLLQHNSFTWDVLGGRFIHLDTVTEESRLIDTTLKEWLRGMEPAAREKFVDSFYETLSQTGAKTLTELSSERVKLVKIWNTLDPKSRSVILKCISLMVKQSARSIKPGKKYSFKKKKRDIDV